MGKVSVLEVSSIRNQSVELFTGTKKYVATGDVDEQAIETFTEITYNNRPSRANIEVKLGQVLFARMKGTNKVIQIDESNQDYIYSTGFCVLEPSELVTADYLRVFLKSDLFQIQKDKHSKGATQKAINNEGISKIKIPLPPLETQKKIVEALDKAQTLIDARKEQIRLMDELVKARFVEMFGELSNNNKKWLEVGLENACSVIYRYPTFYGMEYVESGTPVIRIGNILSNGTVDDELRNYVRVYEKVNADFPQTVIQKDDILMAVRGDGSAAKRIGLVKSQKLNGANISPNLLRIRHKEGVANSIFLFWYLTSDVGQKRLDAFVNKTAKKNIAAKDIKILKTPLPPIDLQNLFAEFVHQVEISRSEMQNSLNEIITTQQALMQQYFG